MAKIFNFPGRYKKSNSVWSYNIKQMKQKVTEVQEVDTLPSKCKIFNTVISVIDKLSRQKKMAVRL